MVAKDIVRYYISYILEYWSNMMSQAVKLSDELVSAARVHGSVQKRSIPKQIEYWAQIGKIAEENPDLPPSFLVNTLLAKDEADSGDVEEYTFG